MDKEFEIIYKNLLKKYESDPKYPEYLNKVKKIMKLEVVNIEYCAATDVVQKQVLSYIDSEVKNDLVKKELTGLIKLFESDVEKHNRVDIHTEYEHTIYFKAVRCSIHYIGTNGEGHSTVKVGTMINIYNTQIAMFIDKMYEFYNGLNLKYTTIYRLFHLIFHLLEYPYIKNVDHHGFETMFKDTIYEYDLKYRKLLFIKKNSSKNSILYGIDNNISIDLTFTKGYYVYDRVSLFDLDKPFDKQKLTKYAVFTYEYRKNYKNKNILCKKEGVVYIESKTRNNIHTYDNKEEWEHKVIPLEILPSQEHYYNSLFDPNALVF